MRSIFKIINPHFITFTLIFMVLFGAFIAVDSLGAVEYSHFVKNRTNDVIVDLEYGPVGSGSNIRINAINYNSLNYYIRYIRNFPFTRHIAILHHSRINKPLGNSSLSFITRIFCINESDFDFLNISLKKGSFSTTGISIREDIFEALNLKLGNVINFTAVTKINGSYIYKSVFLPITSTFTINNTLINSFDSYFSSYFSYKIFMIAPRETFFYLLNDTQNLTLIQPGSFIIGDLDNSLIDKISPEISLDMLERGLPYSGVASVGNTEVYSYCPLSTELEAFIAWKNATRDMLLYSLLPLLFVTLLIMSYLNRVYITVHQREIFVAVARGKSNDYDMTILAKHIWTTFIKSLPVGFVLGIVSSRFFILPASQLQNSQIFDISSLVSLNQSEAPITISYVSLGYSLIYCMGIFLSIFALLAFSFSYSHIFKEFQKNPKRGLRQVLIKVGLAYIDVLLIIFSLFIFILVYNSVGSFYMVRFVLEYNFFLKLILIGSPVLFIIGTTELILRGIHKTANKLADLVKFRLRLLPLFLGLKNISKNNKLIIATSTFALILAFSQASSVVTTAYYPSIKAHYYWRVGSDIAIQFSVSSLNVSTITEIAHDLSNNISFIKSHTFLLERYIYIPIMNKIVHIIGIEPQSFLNTVYTDKNVPFGETQLANKFYALMNNENVGIISKSLNTSSNWLKGDIISGTANNKLVYVQVINELDYKFSYKTFQWGYTEQDNDFKVSSYIITTYHVLEQIGGDTHVTLLVHLSENVNQEYASKIIKARLNALKFQYIQLVDAELISAYEYMHRKMLEQNVYLQKNTEAISFGVSILLVLVFIWAYVREVKIQRSRYIAILTSLGASTINVTLVILSELLFVFVYGTITSILVIFPLSLILGLFMDTVEGQFIIYYFFTQTSVAYMVLIILFSLLITILGGTLVIYLTLRKEKSQLLKLEWTPEKYFEDLKIIWS